MNYSFTGNIEAERVINLVKHTNNSLFLTGKAGTGKSTLLRHIISSLKKKYIILAPTGVAALNVGGLTIHSFFGLGLNPYLPNDRDLPNLIDKLDLLKKLEIIIIDEISMVRVDIMNVIDLTLRKNLNSELPFGGKQLLLIGDLLQLPPVINSKNLKEVEIIRENYKTEFFFGAPVFNSFELEVIELQKVYRQGDKNFVSVLNNIRTNQVTDADLEVINTRKNNHFDSDGVITLTTRNPTVDAINSQKLSKIDSPEFTFHAYKTGTFANDTAATKDPTDTILRLKKDAQIIFIKNDSEKKWVNGTIAKISKIEDGEIEVDINGLKCNLTREIWEDFDYKWNREEDKIEKEVVGTFEQYPIRLAWAITIHKSQGQTFEKAIIDMDTGGFAFGQTYVALSRCTSLNGINLTRKILKRDIKVSDSAVKYLTEKGVDSLRKRDNLELGLIEKINVLELGLEYIKEDYIKLKEELNQLEVQHNETKTAYEKVKSERDFLKVKLNLQTIQTNGSLLALERLKTEIEFQKKEIARISKITWIQKLFGSK